MLQTKITSYLAHFLICLYFYFAPSLTLLYALIFFVIMDTITGVYASIKKGNKFTSKRLRKTVPKLVGYACGILVAQVIQNTFTYDLPLGRILAAFVCYVEIKSINENIEILTNINMFQAVIEQVNIASKGKEQHQEDKDQH